jgi:pimeloyl-ACP methyl ester carboxylesterase
LVSDGLAGRPVGRATSLVQGPNGLLELITTGSGTPSTVFAHGVTGSIGSTRPFGSGVEGSRTFFHFRGYGASAPAVEPLTYEALAADLRAVADHVGATRAFGVSMGAGALCRLLASTPLRFERLVLALPAAVDRPLTDDAPDSLKLAAEVPLIERALLLDPVIAPVLVIAQEADPEHPLWVAEQLAAALPHARLEVLPPGGILLRHRSAVRELVGGFLNGKSASTEDHSTGATQYERANRSGV